MVDLNNPEQRRRVCAELRHRLAGIKRAEIAREAGVSPRSVFYFFNDLERVPHAHTVARLLAYSRTLDRS